MLVTSTRDEAMNWRDEIGKYVRRRERLDATERRSYVDVKGMMGNPDLLYAVVMDIGNLILQRHPEIKAIGSHGVGGSFLIGPTILYVYDHWFNVNGFFVRLDARENHEHSPIEGRLERGWRVCIVDDVIESGASCMKACNILQDYGCQIDGIIVVVDLSNGDNACARAGLKVEPLMKLQR